MLYLHNSRFYLSYGLGFSWGSSSKLHIFKVERTHYIGTQGFTLEVQQI